MSNKVRYWKTFFNFEKHETNNYETYRSFHCYAKSDGKAISLVFDRERVVGDGPMDLDDFRTQVNDPESNLYIGTLHIDRCVIVVYRLYTHACAQHTLVSHRIFCFIYYSFKIISNPQLWIQASRMLVI